MKIINRGTYLIALSDISTAFDIEYIFCRRGSCGMLPIHMAALYGFRDCVTRLLDRSLQFDIDTADDYARTCLHAAACGGYLKP